MTKEHKPNGKVITETQRYDSAYSLNTETRDITHATIIIDRDLSLTAAFSNHGDISLQVRRGDEPIGAYEWHEGSIGAIKRLSSATEELDPNNAKHKNQALEIGRLLKAHLTKLPNEAQAQLTKEEASEILGFLRSDPLVKTREAPEELRGRIS